MGFEHIAGGLCGQVRRPPPAGKLNVNDAQVVICPDHRNIKIHEKHVDGSIEPVGPGLDHQQALVWGDGFSEH